MSIANDIKQLASYMVEQGSIVAISAYHPQLTNITWEDLLRLVEDLEALHTGLRDVLMHLPANAPGYSDIGQYKREFELYKTGLILKSILASLVAYR